MQNVGGETEGKKPPGRYSLRWSTIKMYLKNRIAERGMD